MNKKILYFSSMLFLLLVSCSSGNVATSSDYFKLANATATPWAAGNATGGRGTDYCIYVNIPSKNKDKVKFDSLWADGYVTEMQQRNLEGTLYESMGVIKLKNDYPDTRGQTSKMEAPPIPHSGKLLIKYTIDNQAKYISIKNVTPLQSVIIP
jgi:hypothetical protein